MLAATNSLTRYDKMPCTEVRDLHMDINHGAEKDPVILRTTAVEERSQDGRMASPYRAVHLALPCREHHHG